MDIHIAINRDGYIWLLPGEDQPLPSIIITGDLCPDGQSEILLSTNQVEQWFTEIVPVLQTADLSIANREYPLTHQTTPISGYGLLGVISCLMDSDC